jgi:RNA polymerase sigma-70 factor, ECF subfamily
MTQANLNDWLNEHSDFLYRFALARLRDPHLAEDVVQETFLAAVKSPSFSGQSSPRTWLTGILKHKIIDVMRKSIRETPASDLMADEDDSMDAFFDETGHWSDKPQAWDIPHEALEQKQFLAILQTCVNKLSPKLAALFMLRDVQEEENEIICKELDITATNAWVMLYRARMSVRTCLEINWLNAK